MKVNQESYLIDRLSGTEENGIKFVDRVGMALSAHTVGPSAGRTESLEGVGGQGNKIISV